MNYLALSIGSDSAYTIQAPSEIGTFSLSHLLSVGLTILLTLAVLLTLFFLINGGVDMIMSGGDKQKVVNARHKLTFAVIGLIVVLFSFFIVNVIGQLFNVEPIGHIYIPPFGLPSCFPPGRPC